MVSLRCFCPFSRFLESHLVLNLEESLGSSSQHLGFKDEEKKIRLRICLNFLITFTFLRLVSGSLLSHIEFSIRSNGNLSHLQ